MSDLTAWLREGVQTSDGCSHPIASDIDAADALMSTAADEIDRLTAALAEARDKALEEAAAFVDAHAALEKAGICDLSGTSGPPLTKEAAKSVFEANARKSAQAATYKAIASHFRALKEKP